MKNLFAIFIFLACNSTNNAKLDHYQPCPEREIKEKLIRSSINMPAFQKYVQKEKNNYQLNVLRNANIPDSINSMNFNGSVHFVTEAEVINQKPKRLIEFTELSITGDTAKVLMRYDFEGIYAYGTFLSVNCNWKLLSSHVEETK